MRVAVTGTSGLIGGSTARELGVRGHDVIRLVRPSSRGAGVFWDPATGQIEMDKLEGVDAVVHLAGQSIFGVWTGGYKRRILDSRARGTSLIATSLARLNRKPKVLVSASAIGFYGNHPDGEEIDETAPAGDGFLADVTKVWESAADPARHAGIRVVHPRTGLVLSQFGGALSAMFPVFYLGLGGRLGGSQVWSWITLDDVVDGIIHMIETPDLSGPVNLTAPNPVTNAEFTKMLAEEMHRPAFLPVPEFVLRLIGGPAEELILWGARVMPRKLLRTGFRFRYPELRQALQAILA